jgi:hypothetical protein
MEITFTLLNPAKQSSIYVVVFSGNPVAQFPLL